MAIETRIPTPTTLVPCFCGQWRDIGDPVDVYNNISSVPHTRITGQGVKKMVWRVRCNHCGSSVIAEDHTKAYELWNETQAYYATYKPTDFKVRKVRVRKK